MKNNTLAILGASGHGKVVAELAELNDFSVVFFDDAYPQKTQLEHWPVLGDTDTLLQQLPDFIGVAIGIGNNEIRAEKMSKLAQVNANFITLAHPSAVISSYSEIGSGTVIMAGAKINPFAKVGIGSIINTSAVIEHDCKLEAHVHISPNAALAGECIVGQGAWVGLGASVKQQIDIGERAIIGAGSTVVTDIPAGVTAFGTPAKVKKG